MTAPHGHPNRIWLVFFHENGERHTLYKEPLEGIDAWAKGQNVTIAEYRFDSITHTPPPKKKVAPK